MAKGRKTGGRLLGSHNKATGEIKDLARTYTAAAMAELGRLAVEAESEQARVAAIKELFDRGYGKATQSMALGQDPELNPISLIAAVRPTLTREEWLSLHGS